jgi:hypothetical protein
LKYCVLQSQFITIGFYGKILLVDSGSGTPAKELARKSGMFLFFFSEVSYLKKKISLYIQLLKEVGTPEEIL